MRTSVILALVLAVRAAGARPPIEKLRVPDGFRLEVFTADVPGARSLTHAPSGTVFVGTRDDKVYAVVDADRDGRADRVVTLASGLTEPNGVAFRDGSLWVAEINRLVRFPDVERHLDAPGEPVVIGAPFPSDRHHGWKFIRFGPDGLLYVPEGMPCNVCAPENPIYGTIMRMRPDGGGRETFARGIRNTVGFDWSPDAHELWFTDNGRDLMGDDRPPDELDRAPHPNMDFGFPHCHGKDIPDPDFAAGRRCDEFTAPEWLLPAHVAALGMRFYTGTMFPPPYRGQIFIAEHGSWNRTTPIGYRVTIVHRDGPEATSYETFVDGWLEAGKPWGRPVDVEVMDDGALLVSDDHAGAVYRIVR